MNSGVFQSFLKEKDLSCSSSTPARAAAASIRRTRELPKGKRLASVLGHRGDKGHTWETGKSGCHLDCIDLLGFSTSSSAQCQIVATWKLTSCMRRWSERTFCCPSQHFHTPREGSKSSAISGVFSLWQLEPASSVMNDLGCARQYGEGAEGTRAREEIGMSMAERYVCMLQTKAIT